MRTGLPLWTCQEWYNTLKDVPEGQHGSGSKPAMVRFADSVNISTIAAEYCLKRMALEYLPSTPGPDKAAKNHFVHHNCRHLLNGKRQSAQELELLAMALIYRLKTILARATEYKDRLGLDEFLKVLNSNLACDRRNGLAALRRAPIYNEALKADKICVVLQLILMFKQYPRSELYNIHRDRLLLSRRYLTRTKLVYVSETGTKIALARLNTLNCYTHYTLICCIRISKGYKKDD